MPGATTHRNVHFASTPSSSSRPARDDEIFVMKQFAGHASHCRLCCQPYSTYVSAQQDLCTRGLVYARDVSQYIYSKGGRAFSVIDRKDLNQRVQIEIPRGCEVIRDLLKAVDSGMTLPKHRPVITQEPKHHGSSQPSPASPKLQSPPSPVKSSQPQSHYPAVLVERRPKSTSPTSSGPVTIPSPTTAPKSKSTTKSSISSAPRRRDSVVAVSRTQGHSGSSSPSKSRPDSGIFIMGRGSLYRKDEAERRRRDVEVKTKSSSGQQQKQLTVGAINDDDDDDDGEPIIIRASPGVRVREYHR